MIQVTNKEFKLKTPIEIGKLVDDPNITNLIIYIDQLHSIIKNYQIVIDTAVRSNRNVKENNGRA